MDEIVTAAQHSDLETLRHLIDKELADHPEVLTNEWKHSTEAMDAALSAAARSDQPEAVDMLLDSGCPFQDGTYTTLKLYTSRH